MSFNRQTVQKLDLCGQVQREEQRVQKREQQAPQQIVADGIEAYRRGLNSAFTEANRKIRLQHLASSDPALLFFLTKNRTPDSA